MTRWSVAHSIAHIAAQRARGDAGLAPHQRVDIVALIESNQVQVFGQPNVHLFGAYLPAEPGRLAGVWLHAGLRVTDQRHTAAHEWGHHCLGHHGRCDLNLDDVGVDNPARMRSLEETTAEAFAAWLLMPRAALIATLRTLGAVRGVAPTAVQCYETALALGTTYLGTARHLATARVTDQATSTVLKRVPPHRIKAALDDPAAPEPDRRADVWRLAHFTGFDELVIAAGDRVIIDHGVPGSAAAVEALLALGRADLVTETDTATVMTATGLPDRVAVPATNITLGGAVLRVRIDQQVIGLADADTVPDISALTPDELARMLAEQHPVSMA